MAGAVLVIRLSGMVLGVALLALIPFWGAPPASATGPWALGMASLVALGGTLLLPWAKVVHRPYWWAVLAAYLAAIGGLAAAFAPALFWAEIHGGLGWVERIVVVAVVTILLGQLTAIGWLRWKRLPPGRY